MNESIYIAIISSAAGMCIIITGVILLQVRNQRRLLKKQAELSAAAIAHQKELLQAVIHSQEAERERIGNDLHDGVGATLSSLRMLIEKNISEPTVEGNRFSSQSRMIIDTVIRNVREISHQLSPHISGQFGLFDSLHELCDHVNEANQLQVSLKLEESTWPPGLSPDTAIALYRVVAELLNNTIKHAQAKKVEIHFTNNADRIEINYKDDGIGLCRKRNNPKGMGMQNIESRLNMIQANWEISKENIKGFKFYLSLPLKSKP